MAEQISQLIAIKRFLEKDAKKVLTQEFSSFWKSLSETEKDELARQAADALGLELKSD